MLIVYILADRIAACSVIGYWHDTVCLSVSKTFWASEQEVPPRNTILQFSTPYTGPVPSNSPPLEQQALVPSDELIKSGFFWTLMLWAES